MAGNHADLPSIGQLASPDETRCPLPHVACRRFLVDLGLVKRDRAGLRYFLNYPKLADTLAPEVLASADQLLGQAVSS
jgi:hypothetical protein